MYAVHALYPTLVDLITTVGAACIADAENILRAESGERAGAVLYLLQERLRERREQVLAAVEAIGGAAGASPR